MNSHDNCHEVYSGLSIIEDRERISGWSTDTLAIDHDNGGTPSVTDHNSTDAASNTHTLILFIPGNPGVVHWYSDTLAHIVKRLGRGYAARGVSYAGHGVVDDVVGTEEDHNQSFHSENLENGNNTYDKQRKDMSIPWTMDGQIKHKIEWIDKILDDWRKESTSTPNLIFISHSIGAHFVQSLLIRRPDILVITQHIIHLMPFFRFDPHQPTKLLLATTAHAYKYVVPTMVNTVRVLSSTLPRNWVDSLLEKVVGLNCAKGRAIALDVFMHPNMVKNHLVLGAQELREVPERPNDVALRLIGDITQTSILFCGNDQWAPKFHKDDLKRMQNRSEIPNNIHTECIEELRHDFVVRPDQIDPAVEFCVKRIKSGGEFRSINLRSRL